MTRVQQSGTCGPRLPRLWLKSLAWSVLVWSGTGLHTAAAQDPGTPSAEKRTEWFRHDKFGMFIHWGVYSVPAGEWKDRKDHAEWIMLTGNIPSAEYEKFATGFNPVKFNATEWVRLAQDAGMKYLVITSKHHDGFSMYDSKLTDYDIMQATPGNEQVTIAVPPEMPDRMDTVVALEIQGDPQVSQAQ